MIYLIKSGSYSDIGIHGYFTNEEDAYEYCELVKQKYLSSPAGAWHLDLYVEPVPEMQVEFPKERLAMLYEYSRSPDVPLVPELHRTATSACRIPRLSAGKR